MLQITPSRLVAAFTRTSGLASGAHRPPLGARWPGGVGPGGGHRRVLGALVLLLAPPADHAGESA